MRKDRRISEKERHYSETQTSRLPGPGEAPRTARAPGRAQRVEPGRGKDPQQLAAGAAESVPVGGHALVEPLVPWERLVLLAETRQKKNEKQCRR